MLEPRCHPYPLHPRSQYCVVVESQYRRLTVSRARHPSSRVCLAEHSLCKRPTASHGQLPKTKPCYSGRGRLRCNFKWPSKAAIVIQVPSANNVVNANGDRGRKLVLATFVWRLHPLSNRLTEDIAKGKCRSGQGFRPLHHACRPLAPSSLIKIYEKAARAHQIYTSYPECRGTV